MLFGDTKYDTAGSLTFRYDPIFYGKGPETYAYDHGALQRRIVEQFAEFHDLGVPCEPNNIFVVCNQYPLLAVRFRDAVDGTAYLDPLLASYRRAWDARGGVIDGRDSVIWSLMVRQQHLIDYPTPDNAWTLGALNCWMPDRVRAVSGRYAKLWLKETAEGTLQVRPPHELHAMATGTPVGPAMPYRSPALGYAALWLSEVGDRERLTARESCGQVRRQRRGRVADVTELERLRRREVAVEPDLAPTQRTRAVVEHGQAVWGGAGRG
jgi:hypothetical protein